MANTFQIWQSNNGYWNHLITASVSSDWKTQIHSISWVPCTHVFQRPYRWPVNHQATFSTCKEYTESGGDVANSSHKSLLSSVSTCCGLHPTVVSHLTILNSFSYSAHYLTPCTPHSTQPFLSKPQSYITVRLLESPLSHDCFCSIQTCGSGDPGSLAHQATTCIQ